MARRHALAVAAATVQLAKIRDGEILDDYVAAAIVLDDLVLCVPCTAALDVSRLGRVLDFDAECIFAYSVPPDVVDGAAPLAVNTLDLIRACSVRLCQYRPLAQAK